MGLDTTHDCWHGPYSAFHRWRSEVAKAMGLPPLDLMEGFGGSGRWDSLKPSPLHELLNHSDCEGEILWQNCAAIANALESLLPEMPRNCKDTTSNFIKGLRLASERQENVEFH